METKRKSILYIATSLDGYIAKPNDDLSFLSIVEQKGADTKPALSADDR